MGDSMEPCKMLWGRPLLPWPRNVGKFGLFFTRSPITRLSCMPDRPDMFAPTRGDDQGPIFVAMATFALGAESNRLPACVHVYMFVLCTVHFLCCSL